MTDRIKIDKYTDMFLKYTRARAWLKKQEEDFKIRMVDSNIGILCPDKYNRAKAWLDKQCNEFQVNIMDPLQDLWESLGQEDQDQWLFENESLLEK